MNVVMRHESEGLGISSIASKTLCVKVVPAHGFLISGIYPIDSGVNLLWQRGSPPLQNLGREIDYDSSTDEFDERIFAGGWFAMFPIAGIPGRGDEDALMHGEATRIAWDVVSDSTSSITCRTVTPHSGFTIERSLNVIGSTLFLETRARNDSMEAFPVTFGEHPCFSRAVFAGGQISADVFAASIPMQSSEPDSTKFVSGQMFQWPFALGRDRRLHDVTTIPDRADGRHDHFCAILSSGNLGISSPTLGGSVLIHVDRMQLGNLLLWEHYRPSGSPWSGDTFALELCSAPGRTLDDARESGEIPMIAPGGTVKWRMAVEWRVKSPSPPIIGNGCIQLFSDSPAL